jgi:hypothetical protein
VVSELDVNTTWKKTIETLWNPLFLFEKKEQRVTTEKIMQYCSE